MKLDSASWLRYELNAEGEKRMFDLQHDLTLVRRIRSELENCISHTDERRILVTMSASEKSAPKLRWSVPQILNQADASGLHLDMIIGLNHGAPHAELIRQLVEDRAEIVHLFTCDQVSDGGVEPLFDDPFLATEPYLFSNGIPGVHKVHIVEQNPTPTSKGKNRMLRPIYDGIQESLLSGHWQKPPATLLEIDDESFLFSGSGVQNGLSQLTQEREKKGLDAIGARIRSVCYKETQKAEGVVALPYSDIPVMPEYKFLDECQTGFYRVMVGGGTLGATDLMTAVRWPISHRYPGARCDDLLRTILINELEASWGIADDAHVFNECRNSRDQILRWLCGGTGIMHHLGKEYVYHLVHDMYGSPEIWKKYIPSVLEMNEYAKTHPETLTGSSDW